MDSESWGLRNRQVGSAVIRAILMHSQGGRTTIMRAAVLDFVGRVSHLFVIQRMQSSSKYRQLTLVEGWYAAVLRIWPRAIAYSKLLCTSIMHHALPGAAETGEPKAEVPDAYLILVDYRE